MNFNFGFIGCGNMGGILLSTVMKKALAKEICACDNNKDKLSLFISQGVQEVDAKTAAKQSKFLFLGVKPQVIKGVIEGIKEEIAANKDLVIISMAAGITIAQIEAIIGSNKKIIRIMPNTAAAVEKGIILYCHNKNVTENEIKEFVNALFYAGIVDEIDENKIDAGMALSGCGPAFVDLFIEALADGAVSCGLSREKAILYAAKTVEGAAKTVIETGESPSVLKDKVCSPGGTTIEGVRALEKGKFRSSIIEAVIASYNKAKELK